MRHVAEHCAGDRTALERPALRKAPPDTIADVGTENRRHERRTRRVSRNEGDTARAQRSAQRRRPWLVQPLVYLPFENLLLPVHVAEPLLHRGGEHRPVLDRRTVLGKPFALHRVDGVELEPVQAHVAHGLADVRANDAIEVLRVAGDTLAVLREARDAAAESLARGASNSLLQVLAFEFKQLAHVALEAVIGRVGELRRLVFGEDELHLRHP